MHTEIALALFLYMERCSLAHYQFVFQRQNLHNLIYKAITLLISVCISEPDPTTYHLHENSKEPYPGITA